MKMSWFSMQRRWLQIGLQNAFVNFCTVSAFRMEDFWFLGLRVPPSSPKVDPHYRWQYLQTLPRSSSWSQRCACHCARQPLSALLLAPYLHAWKYLHPNARRILGSSYAFILPSIHCWMNTFMEARSEAFKVLQNVGNLWPTNFQFSINITHLVANILMFAEVAFGRRKFVLQAWLMVSSTLSKQALLAWLQNEERRSDHALSIFHGPEMRLWSEGSKSVGWRYLIRYAKQCAKETCQATG